jgi:hypothetical protein
MRPISADDIGQVEESERIILGMLRDAYEQALDVSGSIWPTPEMALSNLFERGLRFLEGGAELAPVGGATTLRALEALNGTRRELVTLEAQYIFTNYVTFKLTRESDALERTWLELADQHLDIRSEIVAARREEERIKRELAKLGAFTVPLPEHEELPNPGPDRPRKSRGMYSSLFEGASVVEIQLQIDARLAGAAGRLMRRERWTDEWGEDAPLVIVAHGLSLALREREADAVDADDKASVQAAQAAARQRMMGLEGRYSTLRYRLFELRRNVRILGWRITALRIEARGMRARLEMFERDRARLEEELETRRALAPPVDTTSAPEPRSGWRAVWSRLLRDRES